SRSPRRQLAAANPSQLISPNSATKTASAVQLTCSTAAFLSVPTRFRHEIDEGGHQGTDENKRQLEPIEEGNAGHLRLGPVVEGHRERRDELDQKQQIPRAPGSFAVSVHRRRSPGAFPAKRLAH